jgi:hypothetical protein
LPKASTPRAATSGNGSGAARELIPFDDDDAVIGTF